MQGDLELIPLLDPTKIFTDDILVRILRLLPPRQLLKCSLVSSHWRRPANLPDLWEEICHTRWKGKVYIPAAGETNLTWKQKYLKAEADRQKSATSVTMLELTTFDWKFRFKRTAGTWFQDTDPYWVHGKDESRMMKRKFTVGGNFEAPPGDPFHDALDEEMTWKFTSSGEVQVEQYPPLRIRRTPDWGFVLENAWVLLIADLPIDGPFGHGFGSSPVAG